MLFVPVALLATLWLRRPLLVAAFLVGQSALTELVQPVTGGICQASDLVANAIGAVLGSVLGVVVGGLRTRQRDGDEVGKVPSSETLKP